MPKIKQKTRRILPAAKKIRKAAAKNTWVWDSVGYQIYPRSFNDSNGDGIGDLRGITEKLDYLEDLGISAIWLSPFYPSPMADFGYDVSDYRGVDPMFGTITDFKELLKEAHRRGIKVFIDFVPNHTSDMHPWFLESRSSRDNPKRDWYVWRDAEPDKALPNNWISIFGGPTWTYDERTGQYYLHSFAKEQPDLNWENPEVREAMKDNMRFWMDLGIDGFRMDAVHHLSKHKEFVDDPPNPLHKEGGDPREVLLRRHSSDYEKLFDHLAELVDVVKEYGDKFIIMEAYPNNRDLVEEYERFYGCLDSAYSAPFNFTLMRSDWNTPTIKDLVDRFQESLSDEDVSVYVLGNHDRPRTASAIGRAQARVAAAILLTLPGMPFIYQGEELGMENTPISENEVQDILGKNIRGYTRDVSRTPMQWSGREYAGFSTAKPWLPVGKNYKKINAEAELKDDYSFLSLYKKLLSLRKDSEVLRRGRYMQFDAGNENVFAFARKLEHKKVLILANLTDREQKLKLPEQKLRVIADTGLRKEGNMPDSSNLALEPDEALILEEL